MTTSGDVDQARAALLDALRSIPDPLDRARLAGDLLDPVRTELVAIRRSAVLEARELREDGQSRGMTWAAIGKALGVTGERAQMIVTGRTR